MSENDEKANADAAGSGYDGEGSLAEISGIEDNYDYSDDEDLLAVEKDTDYSDDHALDGIDLNEDIEDTAFQQALDLLPPRESAQNVGDGETTVDGVANSVDEAATSAHSHGSTQTKRREQVTVAPEQDRPVPQQAWMGSETSPGKQPQQKQPRDESATASDRDVVVLAIGGRIDIVRNDDIRAQQDGGIGLAPGAEDSVSSQDASSSPKSSTPNQPASAASKVSGPTAPVQSATSQWATPSSASKARKSTQSLKSSSSKQRPLSSPAKPLAVKKDEGDGDAAFQYWLANKNKGRRKPPMSAVQQKTMKEGEEKRKREAAEAVFNGWLTAKQEEKMKEHQRLNKLKELKEEEMRQQRVRKELSEDSFASWCSQKSQDRRRSMERKQIMEQLETERIVTATMQEKDAAYQDWLRKKERSAREEREWMVERRREQTREARAIKKSLESRYHTSKW